MNMKHTSAAVHSEVINVESAVRKLQVSAEINHIAEPSSRMGRMSSVQFWCGQKSEWINKPYSERRYGKYALLSEESLCWPIMIERSRSPDVTFADSEKGMCAHC